MYGTLGITAENAADVFDRTILANPDVWIHGRGESQNPPVTSEYISTYVTRINSLREIIVMLRDGRDVVGRAAVDYGQVPGGHQGAVAHPPDARGGAEETRDVVVVVGPSTGDGKV